MLILRGGAGHSVTGTGYSTAIVPAPETEPVSKKAKFLSSICDASDDDESAQNNAKEELERYMKEKTIGTKDDPLEWWKTKKHQYPLMSHLALKYLCIQAASTAAERQYCHQEKDQPL